MKRLLASNLIPIIVMMANLAMSCSSHNANSPSTGGITVVVQPNALTMAPGQIVPFSASVRGAADMSVAWSLAEGASGGNLTAQGLYTAPATTGTFHVTATSHADGSKSATAAITVATGGVVPAYGGSGSGGGSGGGSGSGGTTSATHVSKDANGWTNVVPSSDSRVVYVSSSVGSDTNDGLTDANPMKTLRKALSLMRRGYPDWLLLRAGDVWEEQFGTFGGNDAIGGRSADEPMLWSRYGTGARPQIQATDGGQDAILGKQTNAATAHLYIVGLDFYDPIKDPKSPQYEQTGGISTASSVGGIRFLQYANDILIEDCYFHFLDIGITFQGDNAGSNPQNIVIRRNVITDMYSTHGHSQGCFLAYITGLLIEENIFDHNAWNDQAGVPADVFNHHLYIVDSNNMTIRNNLILTDGSLSMKFLADAPSASNTALIENNFFFEGEVGIGMGGGGGVATAYNGYTIRNNVLSQTDLDNPTGRGLGWAIGMVSCTNMLIDSNIITDLSHFGNTFGIAFSANDSTNIVSNTTFQNNLIYGVKGQGIIVNTTSTPGWTNNKVINNTIQDNNLGARMITQQGPFVGVTYSGNTYSASNPSNFAWVGQSDGNTGSAVTYAQWLTLSGEAGSQVKTIPFPDPTRSLTTYITANLASLGIVSVSDYTAAIRTQSKTNWNIALMAPAINDYIRAGFGLPALPPSP